MNLRQNAVLLTGNSPLIGAALAAVVVLLLAFGGPVRPATDPPGFAAAGATNPAETRLTATGDAQFAAWAPDGRTLLYTRWSRTEPISTGWQVVTDLWQTHPDGKRHDLLASNAAYPAYSPDGKSLAYLSFLGQDRGDLWILENGARKRLARADWGRALSWTGRGVLAAQDGRPTLLRPDRAAPGGVSVQGLPWPEGAGLYPSPAGDAAAQVRPDGISLWNARGALVKTIAAGPGARVGDLAWSPDGTKLAYSVQGTTEGPELWVADVAEGRERRLIKGDLELFSTPSWSPDSRSLALSRTPTGSAVSDWSEIWLVNADGSGFERITHDEQEHSAPAWSPDGRWLAFGRHGDVWLLDVAKARSMARELLLPVKASTVVTPTLMSRSAALRLRSTTPGHQAPRGVSLPSSAGSGSAWAQAAVTPTVQYRMYLPIIFKNWPPASAQLTPPATIRVYHRLYEPKNTIEVIDFETYVKRVVPREMPASWNAEALKAQAVAARTYGWYKVLNPRSADFDVYDDTWDQVCGPDSWRDPRSDAATDATRGQYIAHTNSVIIAMYSAENGDPTKTGNVAYLQAVNDPVSFGKTLFGHGYGMGQWGARRWADQYAWDYHKILKHYYTGVTVEHPRAASGDAAVPIGSVVGPWSKWYLNSKRALLVANASDDWAVQGVDFYATYNDGATYANRRLGPGTKGSAGWSYLWDLSALPDQPMGASPISVTARVSDYYGNVLSNALTVTTGLDTVVPTGTASFVSKSGDTVTLTLSATDPGASPSGVNRMSFSDGYNWRWEGEKTSGASGTYFFNNVGSAVSDPAASGGQAWKVPAGSAGWVWGPYYKSLPAERGYRAYFRLKTDNVTTTSEIAKLDVVDNGGGRVLGIFKLRGLDFRQANAYQEFGVDFYYTNPETTYGLEFRTNFTGAVDVYLDRVLVVSYPVTYATSATFAPVTGSQVIVKFLDAAENISEDVVVNVP